MSFGALKSVSCAEAEEKPTDWLWPPDNFKQWSYAWIRYAVA